MLFQLVARNIKPAIEALLRSHGHSEMRRPLARAVSAIASTARHRRRHLSQAT